VTNCRYPGGEAELGVIYTILGNGVYSRGMICGGKTVVLLDYVSVMEENIEFFR